MSASEAFAVLDKILDKERSDAADAEYRRCVVAQATRALHYQALTWPQVQDFYEEQRRLAGQEGHDCHNGNCDALALPIGHEFADPLNPSRTYQASGTLYVCARSLRRHICLAREACEFSCLSRDNHTVVCQMTGLDKGGAIISVGQYSTREEQTAVERSTVASAARTAAAASIDAPQRKADTTARKRAASEAQKKDARKRLRNGAVLGDLLYQQLAMPIPTLTAETRAVCEHLFVNKGVANVCRLAIESSRQRIDRAVAQRVAEGGAADPLGFAELASLVVMHSRDALSATLEVAHSLRANLKVRAADIEYLAVASARVLHALRYTPVFTSHDNSVSAKGARTVMALSVLLRLRDGIVGRVTINPSSGERLCRVSTQADADADAMADDEGLSVATYVFVPAHPHLRHMLPSNLPPGHDERMDVWYANMMSHQRRIDVGFCSVLRDGNVDPEHFCLQHHMAPRVDVLSYVPLKSGGGGCDCGGAAPTTATTSAVAVAAAAAATIP